VDTIPIIMPNVHVVLPQPLQPDAGANKTPCHHFVLDRHHRRHDEGWREVLVVWQTVLVHGE
jgi:hypothetical protein